MQSELIFKEALQLSPVEKVKLMELLFQSFSSTKNEALEALWAEHAEFICDEVDKGNSKLYSFEDVVKDLNQ